MEARPQRSLSRRAVPPPAKDGYLHKKAREKKIAGRDWNRRYFQLEMGQLHFSDNKASRNKINDTVELMGRAITLEEPRLIKIHSNPALILKADNELEASEWLAALLKHSQFLLWCVQFAWAWIRSQFLYMTCALCLGCIVQCDDNMLYLWLCIEAYMQLLCMKSHLLYEIFISWKYLLLVFFRFI